MNIAILGAGITGLTLAWKLRQRYGEQIQISIFDRADRPGGWIQTIEKEGLLFELGPRSCRPYGHGAATLSLIEELGLQDELVHAAPAAYRRYVLEKGKLHQLPAGFLGLLTSSWLWRLGVPLCKEWRRPRSSEEDESIEQFFLRRLGADITYGLIDPLVSGIYAGNIKQLSVKSCFPLWHQWEKDKGSLIIGALSHRSKKSDNPLVREAQRRGIFTLKRGMETLVKALASHLQKDLRLETNVVNMIAEGEKIRIITSKGEDIVADHVFSTLPQGGVDLLEGMPTDLPKINKTSVAVVSLGYRSSILRQEGFGYLVPSREKQKVLGVIWDSSAFPQQNRSEDETRLTVMLGGDHHKNLVDQSEEMIMAIALEAISAHMGIRQPPDVIHVHKALESIPQYFVGHQKTVEQIRQAVRQKTKSLTMLGTSFDGVAVNDAIAAASGMIFFDKKF